VNALTPTACRLSKRQSCYRVGLNIGYADFSEEWNQAKIYGRHCRLRLGYTFSRIAAVVAILLYFPFLDEYGFRRRRVDFFVPCFRASWLESDESRSNQCAIAEEFASRMLVLGGSHKTKPSPTNCTDLKWNINELSLFYQ
jgi:hypothetical protein